MWTETIGVRRTGGVTRFLFWRDLSVELRLDGGRNCGSRRQRLCQYCRWETMVAWTTVLVAEVVKSGRILDEYFLFVCFWLCHAACGILVPWPGIEPGAPEVEVWNPNHWTTREFPRMYILKVEQTGLTDVFYVRLERKRVGKDVSWTAGMMELPFPEWETTAGGTGLGASDGMSSFWPSLRGLLDTQVGT